MTAISKGQLQRLQVVYAQYVRKSIDADASREGRLQWASKQLGRTVASFSDLSGREAKSLIDALQGFLGIAETRRARRPRNMTRRDAEKAATEGRHDQKHAETTVASASDLARVQYALDLLGWSRARLEAFLRAPSSPLARMINGVRVAPTEPQIRTLGDANRVWWALKQIAKREGKWRER